MFVALGADHAGFELKESLKRALEARGVAWHDVGTTSTSSVDYPDYAAQVAEAVAGGKADRGILVCGSGIGMAIAANKVRGIRAAPILDVESAVVAREHNDLNVLALSGRRTSVADAERIVAAFLDTPFSGGRHEQRVRKIDLLEQRGHPGAAS
ncbi:MAG: ribose 5-phosphate isomerase B [Acidobacteria bacterium]|nr:ribose 5-phosphate isomerase B [Acidobacteriota bacterium]